MTRYRAECELCGWIGRERLFRPKAERDGERHEDHHSLAFLNPSM